MESCGGDWPRFAVSASVAGSLTPEVDIPNDRDHVRRDSVKTANFPDQWIACDFKKGSVTLISQELSSLSAASALSTVIKNDGGNLPREISNLMH